MSVADGDSDYYLVATATTSHGITLVTSSGAHVGMTRAELQPIADQYTSAPTPALDELVYLESCTRSSGGDDLTDWVSVAVEGDRVTRLYATSRSYGA